MTFPLILFEGQYSHKTKWLYRWIVRTACSHYKNKLPAYVWGKPFTVTFTTANEQFTELAYASPSGLKLKAADKPGAIEINTTANKLVHELSHRLIGEFYRYDEPLRFHKLDWNLTHWAVYRDRDYTYKQKYPYLKILGYPSVEITYIDIPKLVRDQEKILPMIPPYDGSYWV
ncbi:MAG: hypothetical protein QXJ74_06135 [Nitrososphaera sp.]